MIATAIAAAPLIAAATTTAGIAGAANIIITPFSVEIKYRSVIASVDNRGQNAGSAANDSGNYSRTHNITPLKVNFCVESRCQLHALTIEETTLTEPLMIAARITGGIISLPFFLCSLKERGGGINHR